MERARPSGDRRYVVEAQLDLDAVVEELRASPLEHRIVRPCGYFSDMGVLLDMARRGRAFLVGAGDNKMSPIHGRDGGIPRSRRR